MSNLFKRILLFISVFCINGLLYANPSLEKKPKLYVIVIGIGEYPKANFSSKFAKNDANTIYQKLKSQVGYSYTEGNIQLLNQSEQTTHAFIQQAFEDVKPKIKPIDTFFVFIAGEADRVHEEYYLLTSKTQGFSAEQLKRTGLSATQLKNGSQIFLLETNLFYWIHL
ncbi:caspase family protein [Acinetobacter pittii]|uniref:caspase family protein n=1 Tax=Acinetobacter pittii TaxID=48296 RepID=UPI0024DE7424|nr:caspase family protein [Acinetobacter pittii]